MSSASIPTEEFDYVVAGAGSSGAIVASRLSENPANKVLLLEAGPKDSSYWIKLPLGSPKVAVNPKLMWHYMSQPEANLNGRAINGMRGKVLGGGSSVNGMVYLRGAPYDYDLWRQMGAEGWSYEDVLPFFRKAENQSHGENEFHGVGGPVGVEDARWKNPLADAYLEAAQSIGIPFNPDFAQRNIEGVNYFQTTTWKGRRASTSASYLKTARGRANLVVATGALATQLELDGRRVTGLLYEQNGQPRRATARREYVLSAGSINSVQLLQLSGIGPGALLQSLGIPVVHELKGVGENLMDHMIVRRVYQTSSPHTFNAMMRNPFAQLMAGLRYGFTRSGPLASSSAPLGGYAYTRDGLEAPDIEMMFLPFEFDMYGGGLVPDSTFQITFYQNRPESRGTVRIASRDPKEWPLISPNYLSSDLDKRTVIDGLRLIGRIGKAPALAKHVTKEVAPALEDESDEALLAYVRNTAGSAFHSTGTCRMGRDEMAVVDPQLKVHGLANLRIADGSVMPTVPSANTNAACIMIGEKCADMMLRG